MRRHKARVSYTVYTELLSSNKKKSLTCCLLSVEKDRLIKNLFSAWLEIEFSLMASVLLGLLD